MRNNTGIFSLAVELAKEYAGSGAMKTPSQIAEFLQSAYDKLKELNEDTNK